MADIIALVVASTPNGEVEVVVSAEEPQRGGLLIRIAASDARKVDRGAGTAPDDLTMRILYDPRGPTLSIHSAVHLDPFLACVLACVGSSIIDAVTECLKHSKGARDLLNCLKGKGITLAGNVAKCIANCYATT